MPLLVRPFTALFEDVMLEMRENSTEVTVINKYKRRVNDTYARDIPSVFEWDWLHKVGSLYLVARYNTGTVTVVNGSASIVGSSTPIATVWTSAMTGMKFTIPSTNEIYTFTQTGATTGTISPVYQGASGSALSYLIFQDTYELASDYGKPTNEPGFYYDYSQGRQKLEWKDDWFFFRHYTTQTAQFPLYWRENPTKSSNDLYQAEFMPPVDMGRILSYEYIKALPEMVEWTTGTATTTLGSKTVTLSANYSSNISAGQYFRVDSDGTWSKITTIAGATLTIADNYTSTNATQAYTISDAPQMPYQLHIAIFYGACYLTGLEQESKASKGYAEAYMRALGLDMSRRNRKRYGRQQMRHYLSVRPSQS